MASLGHVTNTAHRAPCEILQQTKCRAHTMERQHSSNFLNLHSLVVPIPLNCTLKLILNHFLQPHLFRLKNNEKKKSSPPRIQKGKHVSNFLILSLPILLPCPSSSNPHMTAYITFCHTHLMDSILFFLATTGLSVQIYI